MLLGRIFRGGGSFFFFFAFVLQFLVDFYVALRL
jgi:hypothetical protein